MRRISGIEGNAYSRRWSHLWASASCPRRLSVSARETFNQVPCKVKRTTWSHAVLMVDVADNYDFAWMNQYFAISQNWTWGPAGLPSIWADWCVLTMSQGYKCHSALALVLGAQGHINITYQQSYCSNQKVDSLLDRGSNKDLLILFPCSEEGWLFLHNGTVSVRPDTVSNMVSNKVLRT